MAFVEAKMNTITTKASSPGEWSGLSIEAAKPIYDKLYALGVLSTAHFGIEIEPLFSDALISDASIFEDEVMLPWLANNVDLSLLDAQMDSVQAGHYQINHVTGNGSGEISVVFIETRAGHILSSAKQIKSVMFKPDGSQSLPKDYLMKMRIFIYDRSDRDNWIFEIEHVVVLQAGSVPLSAETKNGVALVTLTFSKTLGMLLD